MDTEELDDQLNNTETVTDNLPTRKRGRPPGSTTANEFRELNEKLSLIMLELKTTAHRMTQLESELHYKEEPHNPCRTSSETETSNTMLQLIQFQKDNLYFQISNNIPTINGKENFNTLEKFFQRFELVTSSLSEKDQIKLLACKLEDNAWLVYNNMSKVDKLSYNCIKNKILNSKNSSSRVANQRNLLSGIKKSHGESFLEYGRRLLNSTKESFISSTPIEVIENLSKTLFIDQIDHPHIRSLLILRRDSISYETLLEETMSLFESHSSFSPSQHKPVIYNSNHNMKLRQHSDHSINTVHIKNSPSCIFCDRRHASSSCSCYPSIDSRIKRLQSIARCTKCTRTGHQSNSCLVKLQCSNCHNGRHHPFLCIKSLPQTSTFLSSSNPVSYNMVNQIPPIEEVTPNIISSPSQVFGSSVTESSVLLKCIKGHVSNPKNPTISTEALIFLDDGSTTSYVSSSLAKKLKLPSIGSQLLELNVFNAPSRKIQTDLVSFNLQLIDGQNLEIIGRTINCISTSIPHLVVDPKLELSTTTIGEPDILIGSDFYYQLDVSPSKTLPSGLTLISSRLGPMIAGRHNDSNLTFQSSIVNFSSSKNLRETIISKVSDFFELEILGISENPIVDHKVPPPEKLVCFNGERYEVSLPWKYPQSELDSNYGLAIGRLKSTLKFLNSKPDLLQKYDKIISEQHKEGIIEQVNSFPDKLPCHYLPHQAVIRQDKNKVRIVYDASAKINKTNLSLNDCLIKGPLLLKNLVGILLRFRIHRFVILSDIEKAFLQVSLNNSDRDFTRFFWVKDPYNVSLKADNLIVYRFCRLAFGLTSSPYLLAIVIYSHFKQNPSIVTKEILQNLYVDNLLLSASSVEEAKNKVQYVKQEFSKFGMNLREFISNCSEALQDLPAKDKITDNIHKILGMQWDKTSDNFVLQIKTFPRKEIISKQSVLSFIASIFDPTGFLSPAILPLKIFLQKLWESNLNWNETLNSELQEEWCKLVPPTPILISIPRKIPIHNFENPKYELHGFCDASGFAFACCIFLRVISTSHPVSSQVIYSKSKVYPKRLKNKLSIHKAELLGLLIAVRALNFCLTELSKDPLLETTLSQNITAWTDSSTILHWLRGNTLQERFIENRLREIASTKNLICNYINTSENPADIASRGCTFQDIPTNKLWWEGPNWMKHIIIPQDSKIPSFDSKNQNHRVNKSSTFTITEFVSVINPDNFSSWQKMIHTIAYVYRFINSCRKIKSRQLHLSIVELKLAQHKLFFLTQRHLPPTKDEIESLNIFRKNELYHCKGRIENSPHSESAKFPIWLPPKSRFTHLFIYHMHKITCHSGPQFLLSHIRQICWISQGRRTVSQVIRKFCIKCRKLSIKPFSIPYFPQLPQERVSKSAVFQNSGVDYFGPISVKENFKTWCCLFTCLSVRAIHLEIAQSLSAECFLHVLRRFMARRGKPHTLISDNGKNFVLAQKILDPQTKKSSWKSTAVDKYLSENGITWSFTTERAPWKGGLYERLIGIVKFHLIRSLPKHPISLSELTTLLTEIEFIVNCRPLTFISDTPDYQIIRPIDFLSPHVDTTLMNPVYEAQKDSISTRDEIIIKWKNSQKILEKFWKNWRNDYLLSLRERKTKLNHNNTTIPKKGEVVLVYEENVNRNNWKVAIIEELLGQNSRSVKLRFPSGRITRRAINHLYPLELDE